VEQLVQSLAGMNVLIVGTLASLVAGLMAMVRGAREEPREGHLARGGGVTSGDLVQGPAGTREIPGGQREPGDKADAVASTGLEHVLGRALDEAVAVLHRGYGYDLLGLFELLNRDIREAYVPDLALFP
jgi:hypothetical protein